MTRRAPAPSSARPEIGSEAAPLPWLLRRVNQRYRAAIGEELADSGFGELPQPAYWALMVLARGGTDASQLIAEMGISKQAVSKIVDSLVTGGFVDRRPNAADRRRTDLVLSAKGRRAARVIGGAVKATDEAFTAELGYDRLSALVRMLDQLGRAPQ